MTIPTTANINEMVEKTMLKFESKFGNKSSTVNVTMWEDGDMQIEVYHTLDNVTSVAGNQLRRRLSTVRHPDGTFSHQEYMVHDEDQIVEEFRHG